MNWTKINGSTIDFRVNNLTKLYPLEAAKKAIESIQKEYEPPYHLMVSGGIDSQAMLYAWRMFGKNYVPTSVIYNNYFNLHDIENIKNISELFDISINYKNFDLSSFLENEYDSFSKIYRCSSPCISAHIKMVEQLHGTIIFSGDYLSLAGATLTDAILGLYRASLKHTHIIPYFFLHTPELAYSFIFTKLNQEYIRTLDDYSKKVYTYQQCSFPVIPQEQKITGFEKVKDYYDLHHWHSVPYTNRLRYFRKPSKRTFDLLYRYPYEEKYKDQKITFLMNNFE